MREIKFRAWVLKDPEYDIVDYMEDDVEAWHNPFHEYRQGNIVLMQYTGLKDKNGKEIYEGDILKGHYYAGGYKNRFIGKVDYVLHGFHLRGINQYKGLSQDFDQLYEVIGNIYENHELLGGESS